MTHRPFIFDFSIIFLALVMAGPRVVGLTALSQQPDRPTGSASLPVPTPSSPFHIAGVLIDAVTKSPVQNATISAVPMTTVKKDRRSRRHFQMTLDSVATDSDGRFDLTVAAAGGWELTAAARNYRAQQLDEHDGYSTAVVLTDAAPRTTLEFRITPASVIQGFVLDEAGEPVRGANVALIYLPPAAPEDQHRRPQGRGQQMTDDRGHYKFAAIAPGTYQIRVSAHPWYATNAAAFGFPVFAGQGISDSVPDRPGPDPLDVVYPVVWYPGAADPSSATPIVLRGGETQEADFQLLPVAGSHLHVSGPADASDSDREGRPAPFNTFLSRILPDGTEEPQMTSARMDSRGNADISGLSPGTYLVHQQSSSSNAIVLSTLQIGAGSPRTVDLSEAVPGTAVTVKVDPAADQDSLQISFRNLENGNTIYAQRVRESTRQYPRHRGQTPRPAADDTASSSQPTPVPDRTVTLPPGKYEVFLNGAGTLHLASIAAMGATATGRTVTIGTGSPKLLLHTASGLGTVTGTVESHGQPDSGAMVVLVPATLGDPSGLDMPSRDQSNSDGSFEMSGLLPGGYILVAIDHGWDTNWSDPSTLRRFLLHGVALDIKPNDELKQTIEAQVP